MGVGAGIGIRPGAFTGLLDSALGLPATISRCLGSAGAPGGALSLPERRTAGTAVIGAL